MDYIRARPKGECVYYIIYIVTIHPFFNIIAHNTVYMLYIFIFIFMYTI